MTTFGGFHKSFGNNALQERKSDLVLERPFKIAIILKHYVVMIYAHRPEVVCQQLKKKSGGGFFSLEFIASLMPSASI